MMVVFNFHIVSTMNPRTVHLWMYILLTFTILTFEVIETDGGYIIKKFEEWRARCRQKFEYFRILYNIWMSTKNLRAWKEIADDRDYILLNDTIWQIMDYNTYQKLGKTRWRNQTFVGKMYNFCSRPINFTNLLKEIKKYTTFAPPTNNSRPTSTHHPKSRLKKVLDQCTQSEYDGTAVVPNTTPHRDSSVAKRNRQKWSWLRFSAHNEEGQPVIVEIFLDQVTRANLSTLIKWLYHAEEMTLTMQNLKQSGDMEVIKQTFGISDSKDKSNPIELIEKAIDFFKDLEEKIHVELRKPEKDWNYSEEENQLF